MTLRPAALQSPFRGGLLANAPAMLIREIVVDQ
jgi:hypothetical protein